MSDDEIKERAKKLVENARLAEFFRDGNRVMVTPDGMDGFTVATAINELEAEIIVQAVNGLSKMMRLQRGNKPLLAEVAKSRPRIELLERRVAGLEELVRCAAKGGHVVAAEIVGVLESFDLTVTRRD